MNYRELQLRQLIKNDYILKTTHQQEKDQLTAQFQQDQNQTSQQIQQLNKQVEGLTLLADKRKEDLEREKQALITLAKQKIANKKEATELVKQLENSWQREKEEWNQEKQILEQELKSDRNKLLEQKEINKVLTAQLRETRELSEKNSARWVEETEEQLKKIGLIFYPNQALWNSPYNKMDGKRTFDVLYSQLKKTKDEYEKQLTERERERANQ
ncbi:MAG: hypothetical protein MRERV_8c048 [Mycoplasmataceae bacterium RV_VA103A]|nr:MAG: hypothetical protein MRERV_29c018 [Mycoplasmataceae bacterium RV_VA103A]KLL04964.1 MAG: hypothetical protein MRERV_8c048 [Mycoplasmataceae bacterium RV_VA103A]